MEIDGQKINQRNLLTILIRQYNVGDQVILKVLRDQQELEFVVILSQRDTNN